MDKYDVIVIGAGPAGIIAAGRAAERGARVLVLEKMNQPGRKLLITGKGRCNITNDAPISEFIRHVFPEGKFLKPAFSEFFSKNIIELLHNEGVDTTLERGGRYFPSSNQAADVLKALKSWLKKKNVHILCDHPVEQLVEREDGTKEARIKDSLFVADNIIIASGGKSYPATGSNGNGYALAEQMGHSIVKPRPALVPLETEGNIAQKMQGLNLKNIKAVAWIEGKKGGEEFGEMLFTHFGLSGPVILTLSRMVVDALHQDKKAEITIDLKPALDEQKLDNRLQRDLNEHGKKQIGNIFKFWLPSAMIPVFIELLNINPTKECHQISSGERKKIRHLLKNLPFHIIRHRSFKEAIITSGGIPLKEINKKTMESKISKGLFFAGEIMDLDAETGGYNLQIAYSTGWLAGNSCTIKN